MRTILTAVFAALLLTFVGTDAEAQKVRNSTLTGTLVSATAVFPSSDSSVVIYVVPAGNTFVMTQACINHKSSFRPAISGTQLGLVPVGNVFSGENCTTYSVGVAFQGGEILSCESNETVGFDDAACLITGVLQ